MTARLRKDELGNALLVAALILLALPFALYAIEKGGLWGDAEEQATSRLFEAGAPLATAAIYGHMVTGGLITVLAPVQLLSACRRHWPKLHRLAGYLIASLAGLTALAGLCNILLRGTIGGPVMTVGFGLYGALMLLSVFKTIQLARRRDARHKFWAERLVILALASWLYRVHYGIWEIATGGLGSRPDFSGPFDIVQVFAFYLPYLAIHKWLWQRRSNTQTGLT